MEMPFDQETFQKRTTIDRLCTEPDFTNDKAINDVRVIERRIAEEDEINGHDCWWYISRILRQPGINENNFPPDSYRYIGIGKADELAEGDLLVYYKLDKFRLVPEHIGIYRGNRIVHSKWGYCHVFEHGIFSVPTSYGFMISVYREVIIGR